MGSGLNFMMTKGCNIIFNACFNFFFDFRASIMCRLKRSKKLSGSLESLTRKIRSSFRRKRHKPMVTIRYINRGPSGRQVFSFLSMDGALVDGGSFVTAYLYCRTRTGSGYRYPCQKWVHYSNDWGSRSGLELDFQVHAMGTV